MRDFVYPSNRGDHIWFVANLQELEERLELKATRHGQVPSPASRHLLYKEETPGSRWQRYNRVTFQPVGKRGLRLE